MYVVFRGETLTDVMCYLCSPADVQRFIESVRGESRPYWQGPYYLVPIDWEGGGVSVVRTNPR